PWGYSSLWPQRDSKGRASTAKKPTGGSIHHRRPVSGVFRVPGAALHCTTSEQAALGRSSATIEEHQRGEAAEADTVALLNSPAHRPLIVGSQGAIRYL